jgi:hypothetical protein
MITIEEINGKRYTVVWHDAKNFNAVDLELYEASAIRLPNDTIIFPSYDGVAFATALPALPLHPKPEDAPLLYRYGAENFNISAHTESGELLPELTDMIDAVICKDSVKIYEASYKHWIVEIAIEDAVNE